MRLPGFVRRNWKLKVLCFFIAFVTWVGVVYAGNPPETKVVSVSVPQSSVTIPAGYVLVHPVNNVAVHVGGDQNTLDSLDPAVITVNVDWAAVNRVGYVFHPDVDHQQRSRQIELIDPPTSLQVDVDKFGVGVRAGHDRRHQSATGGLRAGQRATVAVDGGGRGPEHELSGITALVAVNLSNQKANFEAQVPVYVYDSKQPEDQPPR